MACLGEEETDAIRIQAQIKQNFVQLLDCPREYLDAIPTRDWDKVQFEDLHDPLLPRDWKHIRPSVELLV
jgi:hypothetical protein